MNLLFSKRNITYFLISFAATSAILTLYFLSHCKDFFTLVSWDIIALFGFHTSFSFVDISILFAVLLSTTLTFRQFSQNQEFPYKHSLLNGLLIVIVGAFLLFCYNNWVLPKKNLYTTSMLYNMKSFQPGDTLNLDKNKDLFATNYMYQNVQGLCAKIDTATQDINMYKGQCDSILKSLSCSIAQQEYANLHLKKLGINYHCPNADSLALSAINDVHYDLEWLSTSIESMQKEKERYIKTIIGIIVPPIEFIFLFLMGASIGYYYNSRKAALLGIVSFGIFSALYLLKYAAQTNFHLSYFTQAIVTTGILAIATFILIVKCINKESKL